MILLLTLTLLWDWIEWSNFSSLTTLLLIQALSNKVKYGLRVVFRSQWLLFRTCFVRIWWRSISQNIVLVFIFFILKMSVKNYWSLPWMINTIGSSLRLSQVNGMVSVLLLFRRVFWCKLFLRQIWYLYFVLRANQWLF